MQNSIDCSDSYLKIERRGKNRYARLSFGGFIGVGDKLFAIWNTSRLNGEEKTFVVNVDAEKLK